MLRMMRTMPWDSDDDAKRISSSVPVSMSIAIRQEDRKVVRERERRAEKDNKLQSVFFSWSQTDNTKRK